MRTPPNGVTPGAAARADFPNEKAAGVLTTPEAASKTTHNDLDFPTSEREGKRFTTLVARFALAGHALTRSHLADGPMSYYAHLWGLVRALPTLDDAERFLLQIGGAK